MKITILYSIIFLFLISLAKAQTDEMDEFAYLNNIYQQDSTSVYTDYLIDQLNQFLVKYPQNNFHDNIYWILGNCYQAKNENEKSLLQYYKILSIYPNSAFNEQTQLKILDLLQNTHFPDTLSQHSKSVQPLADKDEAAFLFIRFFYELNDSLFNKPLIDEIAYFLLTHAKSKYADILLFWQGKLYHKIKKPHYAEAVFKEVLYFYPASPVLNEVKYHLAQILWQELEKYDEAKNFLIDLINNPAASNFSADAQYELACLYDDSLKNSLEAKQNYQLLINNYPQFYLRNDALERLVEITEKEENWLENCNYLQLLYENTNSDSLSITYLERMEFLCREKTKDYEKLFTVLLLLGQKKNDAQYLYRAGEITKENLNDKIKLEEIKNRLQQEYPGSEWTKKAENL